MSRRRRQRIWLVIGLVAAVAFLAAVGKVNHVMNNMIATMGARTVVRAAQTFAQRNGGAYPSSFMDEDQEGCTLLDYLPRSGLENPFTGTWNLPLDGLPYGSQVPPGAIVYEACLDGGFCVSVYDDDGDTIVVLSSSSRTM